MPGKVTLTIACDIFRTEQGPDSICVRNSTFLFTQLYQWSTETGSFLFCRIRLPYTDWAVFNWASLTCLSYSQVCLIRIFIFHRPVWFVLSGVFFNSWLFLAHGSFSDSPENSRPTNGHIRENKKGEQTNSLLTNAKFRVSRQNVLSISIASVNCLWFFIVRGPTACSLVSFQMYIFFNFSSPGRFCFPSHAKLYLISVDKQ